ncbi:transposase [Actinomadura montaniterrae]|uniref:Transposase n=1 Tax=Actinomadura montaniterrae TaxID=1803903 RepID=A0A6L3W268_9ACTN|nr:transposase [Actinomadura montaniterrae]KAB2384598.1 transposase [Actinomadura montaniterrae]
MATEPSTNSSPVVRRGRTVRDVLSAALGVLDEGGLEALTMAATAARLGVTPMAIYRHVKDRDALLAGVSGLVLEDVAAPGPGAAVPWDDAVELWMRDVRRCLVAHPWIAPLFGTHARLSPAWAAALDRLLTALERGPLDDDARADAFVWIARTTVGVALLEAKAPLSDVTHDVGAALGDTVPGASERWSRIAGRMAGYHDDDLFDDLVRRTRARLTDPQPPCFIKQAEEHDLSDDQWACIAGLLPPDGRGPHWIDHRAVIDGIRFRERTGVSWRRVPARYGHWRTIYGRFQLWTRDGTWRRITTALES